MAARCARDVVSLLASPSHVVRATLTALKSRLRGAGPVALRDVDALRIKGLEQDAARSQVAPVGSGTSTKLKTNAGVLATKDR